jgi:hypothetical protein
MAMAEVRGDGMIETKTYCDVCKKEDDYGKYYLFNIEHHKSGDGIFRSVYLQICDNCIAKIFPEEIRFRVYKELK